MSEQRSGMTSDERVFVIGIGGVIVGIVGVAGLVKMGYNFGVKQAKRLITIHNKEVKRSDKREKSFIREQEKRERKRERDQRREEKRQRIQEIVDKWV